MAIRLVGLLSKQRSFSKRAASRSKDVPKSFLAVYVGKADKKCFAVPVSYLNHPSFQDLLHQAEDEFGLNHPMGGLTIPCSQETLLDITSNLC